MEIITGMLSLDECRKSIKNLATSINEDISSTLINTNRSKSLRALLDLFDKYNSMLITKGGLP